MRKFVVLLQLCLVAASARATVRVFIQDGNGLVVLKYQCTAGEVVRAFALDVSVDRGQILTISNFFVGPSRADSQGYGIFPTSFRDRITVNSGTNAEWTASGYSPLAAVADDPVGTLPGLNSAGVTLEFAAIWDPTVPATIPPSSGTLCTLQLSRPAKVTVVANASRRGIIGDPPEVPVTTQFVGALVGPAILNAISANSVMTVLFQGGELESAPAVDGPWTGTGNTSGTYTEPLGSFAEKFFRVHLH